MAASPTLTPFKPTCQLTTWSPLISKVRLRVSRALMLVVVLLGGVPYQPCGLACVDASVPGLLASRERVEAELLAELDVLLEQRGRSPT